MNTDNKAELFERTPVPKAIAALAVPTIISQLINLVYNVVDTFFIGRTGDPHMVAGVTMSFTLFMMITALANLFGIGGGSLAARLLGKGQAADARKVSAFSFYGAFAVAFLYGLLIALFLDPLLRLLGASQFTIGYARQYVWLVVILGSVPTTLSAVGAHLLRNMGYSRQASLGLSGGGLLNIALDPLFMFVILPKGWEVLGAALATLLSNAVACVYMIVALCRYSQAAALSVNPMEIRGIRREDLREVISVGVPSAILPGLFDVANIVLNALMAAHSDLALAAIGIMMKAERLPTSINLGICQGMMPIVAYNYSSGSRERMSQAISTARRYGLAVSTACVILFELFASPVSHAFLSTSAGNVEDAVTTVAYAAVFLRIRCLASPVQFLNYHTSYCMQAMGDGRDTLIHAVVRIIALYIPFMFVLDRLFGMNVLASALFFSESCAAAFAMYLLHQWIIR